jgi:hypothetical protein
MRREKVPSARYENFSQIQQRAWLRPVRPKTWHFLQVESLEVIEAVARGTEAGRIGFIHRRFSFFGRPGDFNVAMRRLRHCPNGFPQFCNVTARGAAATLSSVPPSDSCTAQKKP